MSATPEERGTPTAPLRARCSCGWDGLARTLVNGCCPDCGCAFDEEDTESTPAPSETVGKTAGLRLIAWKTECGSPFFHAPSRNGLASVGEIVMDLIKRLGVKDGDTVYVTVEKM